MKKYNDMKKNIQLIALLVVEIKIKLPLKKWMKSHG